ncbi:MAG: heme-binding protein [Pseudomonadota bacterium]
MPIPGLRRAVFAAAMLTLPAAPATADEAEALANFEVMTPDTAVSLAQATLAACRQEGYQIAVAVLDRFGQPQVVIRDRFAGPHTVPTATAKAWTAVSFRGETLELDTMIVDGTLDGAIRGIPGALFLGGGLPVMSAGSIVGGIGVSGAPEPSIDDECARAGIEAISELLEF